MGLRRNGGTEKFEKGRTAQARQNKSRMKSQPNEITTEWTLLDSYEQRGNKDHSQMKSQQNESTTDGNRQSYEIAFKSAGRTEMERMKNREMGRTEK